MTEDPDDLPNASLERVPLQVRGKPDGLRRLAREVQAQANVAIPTAIGNAFEYLPVISAMAVVGHLPASTLGTSRTFLDAAAIGRAYFNCTAMAPGFGLITALRTLCPQAVGAGQAEQCAVYVQQAVVLFVLAGVPCCALQMYAEQVLVAIGQDAVVARLAASYCQLLIPTYFFVIGMTVLQRVMQAHGLNYQNLFICACVGVSAPGLQIFFCEQLGMGYLGAAVASGVTNFGFLALQVPYLTCGRKMWYLFRPRFSEALQWKSFRHYVGLAVPGFFANCLEWWVFEVTLFASGLLQEASVAVAASAVATTMQAIFLMAWIGLLVASAVGVGQAIGAGNVIAAKRSAAVSLCLALGCAGIGSVILYSHAGYIAQVYSDDEVVQILGARILRLMAFVIVVDACNQSLSGILSGLGRQRASAWAQMCGYYLVGTPIGLALAFGPHGYDGRRDGIFALWGGIGLSMLTSGFIQLLILARANWKAAAIEAARRLDDAAAPMPSEDIEVPASPGRGAHLRKNRFKRKTSDAPPMEEQMALLPDSSMDLDASEMP